MCKAKRMSPCCDDRIISSGFADTACILIFLSCEAFCLTSVADLIWPLKLLLSLLAFSAFSDTALVLSCWIFYFHSDRASDCEPRALLIHFWVCAICDLWVYSFNSVFGSAMRDLYIPSLCANVSEDVRLFFVSFSNQPHCHLCLQGDIEATYFFWYSSVDCSVSSI